MNSAFARLHLPSNDVSIIYISTESIFRVVLYIQ